MILFVGGVLAVLVGFPLLMTSEPGTSTQILGAVLLTVGGVALVAWRVVESLTSE